MSGSMMAAIIEAEMRREKYYKNKLKRQKCTNHDEKQCDDCKYFNVCENREVKDEKESNCNNTSI